MPFMGQNLLIQYYGTILQGLFKLMESYMYLPISVFLPFLSINLRFFFSEIRKSKMSCFSAHTQIVPLSISPAVPQSRSSAVLNCPCSPIVSKSFSQTIMKKKAVEFCKMCRTTIILKPFQVRLRLPLVLFVCTCIMNHLFIYKICPEAGDQFTIEH